MLRLRPLAAFLSLLLAFCLLGLWSARSQTGGVRRVTNTTDEGISVNPSLSGDGRRIAFESTEDLAGRGGPDQFRAISADISGNPAAFTQMGLARAPAPGISQDGSIIVFAAKEDPLGTNADGNSEIFLFNGATLRQITNTTPNDISRRVSDGNFQPSLSDDGRFIAFSSNRNLASQNADGNLEIFIYDASSNSFTQLTNTIGTIGASDAKISGDGTRVAYIRNNTGLPAVQRDLVLQERVSGVTRLLAGNVPNLAFTFGRAISDDGSRVVYSADIAENSSQVFLFDGQAGTSNRQITTLGARATDVPLHPTISGDGLRIAFATRRVVALPSGGGNSDSSIELYTYDIPTNQFARVTNVDDGNADGFNGSNRVTEVVSSLNDDGSIVAFNFPRRLSGEVTSGFENTSEIYVTATAERVLTILNEASFGHEPSPIKAVAPDSNAVALGGALAFTIERASKQPDGTFPTTLGGTTVTVNGRRAQISFVSPTRVNFIVPAETELGIAEVVITNSRGGQSRGTVTILRAAPGIFTLSGDGLGEGVVLNADTLESGPFDPTGGNLRLIIFSTGVRNATQVTATANGRALTVESVTASPDMPGLDEVRVRVPADLRGAGTVNLVLRADGRDSNPVTVIFTGDPRRDIVINEVLADPPDGTNGDANRDGVRSGTEDEFVEIVNTTACDIDISGYQLLTRSTSAANDTVRHTFAPGTIFAAGSSIVVFGGGNLNPNDPVFGGAQLFTASTGGLSLINDGGVVTLRDASQAIVGIFSYGGSTGLNGNANQSLTRSPDVTGNFTTHTTATGSGGRVFSPGTRVDGTPFAVTAIARIEVSPPSATINAGATQQFTARAFDANNQEIPCVIFFWQSSNTSVATINQSGLATSISPGTTEIRASARGVQSAPAILTVQEVERVLTSVEVSPSSASIPVSGTQQFTARGLDQFGNEIMGLTFTWESTNTAVATIDANGLATGVSQGQTTIRATSQGVTGTATLNVTPPTVVINEALADPPAGITGDANRDGVRGDDDEFVELVNSTNAGINISGWTLRTRSTNSSTENVRHTFAANTTLPAGEAIVVFGGGGENFNPANAAFACAQVVKASSGGLSLTNTGLTIIIRDSSGNLIAQFSYGTGTGLAADNDQSLTRSPDITGGFVQHTAASGAEGRRFSPGTRVNGTPFGSCPARLTSITISPPSASIVVGQSTQFTAQAFDQFGQPMTGVTITFASDNTSVATIGTVTTDPGTGIATATVTGQTPGTAHITAQATDGTTTVTSSQSTLTVNATPVTYVITGQVTDGSGNPVSGVLITFEKNFQGTLTTQTTTTDANGNYSSGDLGCQNTVKVTPSKDGFTFSPSAISFVNSSQCLNGSDVANFTATPTPPPSQGTLVISQVYGGGGNANAPFTHDFIEIFNRGTTAVDVTGWSVQYQSATSTAAFQVTPICPTGPCVIQPGKYFLVQEASNAAVGNPLPTPDATGTITMAATAGRVALVSSTTPIPSNATCAQQLAAAVDFVGYGTNAICFEGSGPAPAPSATTADHRLLNGCTDTNNNVADFTTATPNPRNSSSPLNDCTAPPAINITINDATVTEGDGGTINATFTVTLSAASSSNVTVDFATANGTATAGSDYQSNSGTLTFTPGMTTQTINVTVNGDTADEPNETFFVNLTNATNGVISDNQGLGTINDNDAQPTLSINDTSVAEGNGETPNTATFTVTLSAASGFTVTVNYATADGSATAGTDYQSTNGTLTFNPGETTQTINVLVNGDTTFEPDETFLVNLTGPTNATISDNQGQGTITNDDEAPPVPAITINDVNVTEGNSGTKTVDFTVSLSMNPTTTVTVDYATANGTATAGSDYQSTSGTLTFNPGETSKLITVTINGDPFTEPDETFFVNLSNASANATLTDSQGVGTITNDDVATEDDVVINEFAVNPAAGNGREYVELLVTKLGGIDMRGWTLSDNPSRTTGSEGDITLPSADYLSNVPQGTFVVIVLGVPSGNTNTLAEDISTTDGNRKLVLIVGTTTGLTTSGTLDLAQSENIVLYAGTRATGTMIDQVQTGANNTHIPGATFGDNSDADLSDNIDGDNSPPASPSAATPIPSNASVAFCPTADALPQFQNNDTGTRFTTTPSSYGTPGARNSCVGGDTSVGGTGPVPAISISDATPVTEGNTGTTTTATFTVTLALPSTQTITVQYATQDVTATAGADYVAIPLTTLTFNPNETSKTIEVTVNGDAIDEIDETFNVNLSNPSNAVIMDGQGVGTITDDDDAPTISINDPTAVTEGAQGTTTTVTFNVTLSAPSGKTVTVNYATANGTATASTTTPAVTGDYEPTNGTLTFNPGETLKTITVTVNGDNRDEPDTETFNVTLSAASNATILDDTGVGTITDDDALPSLAINDPAAVTEGNSGPKTITFTVTLTGETDRTVTVDYATQDNTATTANSDYLATSGTLTFLPGVTSQTFDVTITGDTAIEPDETFFVNLTLPAGSPATISDPQGVGTITNDDTATPTFSIESKAVTEGTGSNTVVNYTVTVSPTSTGTVTVDYTIAGVTATVGVTGTPGADATASSLTGTLTFGAGVATQDIPVTIIGDSIDEADETFTITLSNPSPGTAISATQGTGTETITDDDVAAAAADLSITKTDTPDPLLPGNTLTYKLDVANIGPDTATSVSVTDNLPSSVTFVSCASTGGGSCSNTGNNVTVTFPSLTSGATATITLTVTVNSGTGGTTITNTANITSATFDPQSGNDSSTSTTNVARAPGVNELIINEVLANPNSDANRDGTGAGDQRDEFVEIYNSTSVALDLSLLNLYDSVSTSPKHTFPANTLLQPGKAIVIFGGETGTAAASNIPGIPAGTSSKTTTAPNASFGGAIVQVASSFTYGNTTSALGLNNTGSPADSIRIFNGTAATGTLLASATFPAPTLDRSFTRADNEAPPNRNFVSPGDLHPQVTNAASVYFNRFYSPGFKTDGVTPF